jgi:hypothetical protein
MTARFVVHLLNILKKWLSQLARRFTGSLSLFLFLLRQFASNHLKLGACGWRLFAGTRFSSEALPRSQGNIAREDAPICSSFLPTPPSDDPYSTHSQHSQHLQKVTAITLSQIDTTIRNGSTAEIDGGSTSNLHQSLQTREDSGSRTFSHGGPLEGPSSPGPSRSLVAAPMSSTAHLRLSMHSSVSHSSGRSSARLTTGSRCGQSTLRPHDRPRVYHITDIHDIAPQNEPSYLATGYRVGLTAPPGSDDGKPGSKIVKVHKPPEVFPMVAAGVMRYQRCIPR